MSCRSVLCGRRRLADFPHTHRSVLLKLSVWAARGKETERRTSRAITLFRRSVSGGHIKWRRERVNGACGVSVSAQASAGETIGLSTNERRLAGALASEPIEP